MKKGLIALLTLLFIANNAYSEKVSINNLWKFESSDVASAEKADFDDSQWTAVTFPHCWNAEDAFDDVPEYYRGVSWYRKQMMIPASKADQQVFIHFEAANQVAELFVNGQNMGKHIGGYTGFAFDITAAVKFGELNTLAVKVNNEYNENIPPLSGDFSFFGGIYRDVYIIYKNAIHFDLLDKSCRGVYVSTPAANKNEAQVHTKANLTNSSNEAADVKVCTKIFNADWKLVTEASVELSVAKNSNATVEITNKINKPALWSPSEPYLYTTVTRIINDKGETLDESVSPLGVRWFGITETGLFTLNGEVLKLIGTNRHQDFDKLANALPNQLHENDIKILKEMGANFLRGAHYPQDHRLVEACDKYGIILWLEIPLVNTITENQQFTDNCKSMMVEMIRQYYNNPSLAMWGLMNEVLLKPRHSYTKTPELRIQYYHNIEKLLKELNVLAKDEDPLRLTALACHFHFPNHKKYGIHDVPDVVGYNVYFGWYSGGYSYIEKFLKQFKNDYPGKCFVISECGAGADPRIHSLKPEQYDFSVQWQKMFHKHYLKVIRETDYSSGMAIWNLADFGAEKRRDAVPHINSKGIIAYDRTPKSAYQLLQASLLDEPVLNIGSPHWKYRTGNGDKNCKQTVNVFSNADKVELFLNGKSLGSKKTDNYEASFEVPFVHGNNQLKAAAKVKGKKIEDMQSIDFNLVPQNLKKAKLSEDFKINVSLGAPYFFVDELRKEAWMPEQKYESGSHGYVGGETYYRTKGRIGGREHINTTENDPLYHTMREKIEGYRFDVPNGKYEVTMHFSELYSQKDIEKLIYDLGTNEEKKKDFKERVFNVKMNNRTILESFSPARDFGEFKPVIKQFEVLVEDGSGIKIDFESVTAPAILNAIQLRKLN